MEKHTIGVAVVSTARLTTLKKFFRLMLFASFKAAVRSSVRHSSSAHVRGGGASSIQAVSGAAAAADRHSADGREAPAAKPCSRYGSMHAIAPRQKQQTLSMNWEPKVCMYVYTTPCKVCMYLCTYIRSRFSNECGGAAGGGAAMA